MSGALSEINWLDRLIGFFSPETAYKRIAYRQAYSAGEMHRRQDGWMPVDGNAERLNTMSREIVRRKARDLERNSDIMNALLAAFERNVVGSGFVPQADTGDEELNNQIERVFREWCKPKNCDISGVQSFNEMCNMIVRRLKVDGGILLLKTYGGNKSCPFQLQTREVSDLDGYSLGYQRNGKHLVSGIEVDDYGKPLAYWIKQEMPDGWSSLETKRIPADKVIALWEKKSPSQIREMSPMAQTITRIADAEDYLGTVSLKEKILACFGVFIKRAIPSNSGLGRGTNKVDIRTGLPRKTVTPGMIQELQPGDEPQAVVPTGQASNAKDMLSIMIRLVGLD